MNIISNSKGFYQPNEKPFTFFLLKPNFFDKFIIGSRLSHQLFVEDESFYHKEIIGKLEDLNGKLTFVAANLNFSLLYICL
jgi:hypothetical protein